MKMQKNSLKLNQVFLFAFGLVFLSPAGRAAGAKSGDVSAFDSRMKISQSVSSSGLRWIDGRDIPVEGRMFENVSHWYDRLPSNVTVKVNAGVRSMKHHTAGMQFRFRTDSRKLVFKWTPFHARLAMDHMPSTGVSGIDVYRFDEKLGRWLYVKTGRINNSKGGSLEIPWTPGDACLVNLPLYNGIKKFTMGVESSAYVKPLEPRKTGIDKPVVFYGTSITHGGCASRPGMSFVNIIGRNLDVPVVNLGFSGSGVMELEMSGHLAAIDASCYVLDCLWNMRSKKDKDKSSGRNVEENYEPFIRNLRAKRPETPIVMAGLSDVYCRETKEKEKFVKDLYEKLVGEGWQNLVYLPGPGMYADDFEGTVDGVHPNDWGMMALAKAYGNAVLKALQGQIRK